MVLYRGQGNQGGLAEVAAMTSEIDVYRSAHALIQQHGDEAAIEAAIKADAMLDKGDLDGGAVWRRIVAAVNEMLSTRPGDDYGRDAVLLAVERWYDLPEF